jgi:hypothetical protein
VLEVLLLQNVEMQTPFDIYFLLRKLSFKLKYLTIENRLQFWKLDKSEYEIGN